MSDRTNVLVSCGGRWTGTVLQMREAMRKVPALESGKVFVAGADEFTPAGHFADGSIVVPPIRDPLYIDRLIEACETYAIRVLVPLIDQDLERLSPHIDRFAQTGTAVVCPPTDLVDLGMDKLRFAQFAESRDLDHPRTCLPSEVHTLKFPVFYKERRGHGSLGTGVCDSLEQAMSQAAVSPDILFQECIDAKEITVDAYIARTGQCTVCVPRVRDKIVAGESYNTHTTSDPAVSNLAMRTIAALADEGLRGPLNVQMFLTDPPMLLEVNTRIGSANVLSNVATGGRFLQSVLHEAVGGTSDGDPHDFIANLSLSRFLGDIFHVGSNIVAVKPG